MSVIYLEGGGDSPDLKARCREGFRKLLTKCDLPRMPRLVACGGREAAFDHFATDIERGFTAGYVGLLVDSEEPLHGDVAATWAHLQARDGWEPPNGADDNRVLLMTTCMETWVVADRAALKEHYGASLRPGALPALDSLEARLRHDVQAALARATQHCTNAYAKGKRSFAVLAALRPDELAKHLPSFARVWQVLSDEL